MESQSLESLRVKKLTPRLFEIMNRMVLGQSPKQIREEFGISQARFSIIVNSPLFKLELKRKLLKREDIIFDIQENILEGAKLGTKLYRDILDSPDGYPTDMKMKAANAAASLAVKLISGSNGGNGGNGKNGDSPFEGKSYEERLREVTFKETIKTVTPSPIEPDNIDFPPDEIVDERDLLFGSVDEGEDFNPRKIEEILERKDETGSINDAD